MDIQGLFALGMKRQLPPLLDMARHGLVLNLGAGKAIIPGTIALDFERGWDADTMPLPYPNDSVDGIHSYHFFEHLNDPAAVLMECQRVLKPGGVINIGVPYYRCQQAHHDVDHKKFYTEKTFFNMMCTDYYDKFGRTGKWALRIHVTFVMFIEERCQMLFVQLQKN